jgi:AraC-like DNA-binding protein
VRATVPNQFTMVNVGVTVSIPPERSQSLETRDLDELAERLGPLVGRAWLDVHGKNTKFNCRIRHIAFGDVGIIHGRYHSGLKARFPDFNTFAGSPASLKGSGRHVIGRRDVNVSKSAGAIVSPGGAAFDYGPQFEHLSMLVRPAALTGKLAAIVGDMRFGPLQFDPAVDGRDYQSQRLGRLIRFAVTEVGLSWPMPPIMLSELQQAMMTCFLLANAHNYSGLLQGTPAATAPWQVRRAEQFIEEHWNQPITIEALVAATNVSARSLFSSFKAGRGYSPMDFVKRVRLSHARQKLLRPDADTSVTAVAFECGFGNPGHFALDYRNHFGERPSETLRRSKSS